ncbi:MAG TPA: hypothetical protein VFY27_08030 [Woeseiaceae bacterium]|nr:hypothetical protein [Woeseiaceae bacterium]
MQLVQHERAIGAAGIVAQAAEPELVGRDVQAPLELSTVEVESQDAVEAGRGQVKGAFINRDLVTVLEVAVAPAPDPLEVRRVGEEFIAGRDVERLPVERDAT